MDCNDVGLCNNLKVYLYFANKNCNIVTIHLLKVMKGVVRQMFSNDTFVVCLPGKYIPASNIRSGTSAIDFGTSTSFRIVDTDKKINFYYYNTYTKK